MSTLSGTLVLDRVVVSEVVEDPNITPRVVVAGSAGSVGGSTSGKTDDLSQEGSFRTYGGGNTRLILGSTQTRTQTLALRAITDADLDVLKALLGHTICYRDTYGRRIFGAFLDLNIVNIPLSGGKIDVGLVIQTLTYDEGV
jgi:hypothetical protein